MHFRHRRTDRQTDTDISREKLSSYCHGYKITLYVEYAESRVFSEIWTRREALLLQTDHATRLSVEILQLHETSHLKKTAIDK